VFIGLLGLGTVGVVTGSTLSEWYQEIAKDAPTGLSALLPGGGGWRYYTVTGDYPSRSHAEYTLDVGGLVDRPFRLGYDELAAMPPTRLDRYFQCVTGWRVADVKCRACGSPTSSTAPPSRRRAGRCGSRASTASTPRASHSRRLGGPM